MRELARLLAPTLLVSAVLLVLAPAAAHGDVSEALRDAVAVDDAGVRAAAVDDDEPATAVGLPRVARAVADGVRLGLIVALGAVGLSLIFATSRLVHFAHGELMAFGGLLAFFLNTGAFGLQLHLLPAAALAVIATALLGGALERVVWRPLRTRRAGGLRLHALAITLALLSQSVFGLVWFLVIPGGALRPYEHYAVQSPLEVGPLRITPRDLVVIGLAVLVLAATTLLLQRTKVGKAIRATADNPRLAVSSGIDVQRMSVLVWLIGGGLAGLGGVFVGVSDGAGAVMGLRLLLLLLAAVVLGGIGSVRGAILGGLAVGVVAELTGVWVSPDLALVWVWVIAALVLSLGPETPLDHTGDATPLRPARRRPVGVR